MADLVEIDEDLLSEIDEELLAEIVQNMSYDEMLNWCNTSSGFRDLCEDSSSLIYRILRAKRHEDVVAEVDLVHIIPDNEYRIGINVAPFTYRNAYVPRVFVNIGAQPEDIEAMIEVITGRTRKRYSLTHETHPELRITYKRGRNEVLIRTDQANFGTFIDADIFVAILEAGLRAYNRGIEDGRIAIFRDFSSRLILDRVEDF